MKRGSSVYLILLVEKDEPESYRIHQLSSRRVQWYHNHTGT